MGKRPVSILKSTKSSLFTYPTTLSKSKADKEGYRGVIIRITNKDDVGEDFECYTDKGERIKSKEKLANGKIPDGQFSKEKTIAFNNTIHRIHSKVMEYIDNNTYNKDLLWKYVYGDKIYKRKRTKYITVPIHDKENVFDALEIEKKEVDEFMNQYFTKNKETGKQESITDPETGEFVIQSEEDFEEILVAAHSTKERGERIQKLQKEIAALPTSERYAKGYFNKKDIFEVFAK
jgi:hypothetical protein